MVSRILSATVIGLEAQLVHVEVHFSKGKTKFFIVGLPDKACSESKERVSAIIRNFLGKRLPAGTITVNLAPADILKSGPVYDLPIAIGVLHAIGKLDFDPEGKLLFGELGLDGKTRHTNAVLSIADLARRKDVDELYIPAINAREASLIPDARVFGVKNLTQLIEHFIEGNTIKQLQQSEISSDEERKDAVYDLSLVKGQEHAKRALEIAAAGGHNILMVGTPGAGKTLLSRTLPTILPDLTLDEQLEVTRIYSVAGLLPADISLVKKRPFRKPHHTTSHVALVGGGTIPRPGEITLAHRGVLFLDEFSEFSKQALEALRQPLEDGIVTISRAKGSVSFPARMMLIAAMNPCRCGWLGDEKRDCTCMPSDIIRYKKRISGPVLDRIDMQINVYRVEYDKLESREIIERSENVRERVQKARDLQQERYKKIGIISNSEMGQKEIEQFIKLDLKSKEMLKKAVNAMNLSARSYYRIIKLSRTIADLEGSFGLKSAHVAEALSFRMGEDQ